MARGTLPFPQGGTRVLWLTGACFASGGRVARIITGSYDRLCKVWDTSSGEELCSLDGHKNVVYAVAFNNPFGDKVAAGSFDKTCKLWDTDTGRLFFTLIGHTGEIVYVTFNPQSTMLATGSMDHTARLWDVRTGTEICTLRGHTAEIICLQFSSSGDLLVTGSFDHTLGVWDVSSGRCVWRFRSLRLLFCVCDCGVMCSRLRIQCA